MYDLLLKHGTVVDGTGAPAFAADVAVHNGRIVALHLRGEPGGLGQLSEPSDIVEGRAAREIDCTGMCISPGWVDFHGHADWMVYIPGAWAEPAEIVALARVVGRRD